MNKFCKASGGDTGVGNCTASLGVIYGLVFAPKNFTIPKGQEGGSLLEYLQTEAYSDDPSQRIYPITGVGEVTFEGEEPTMGTLASTGKTVPLRAGTQIYLLGFESSICIDAVLNKYNNYNGGVYILTVDPTNSVYGYVNKDGDLAPIPLQSVAVFGGGFSDGQNTNTTKMRINLGSDLVFKRNISRMDFAIEDVIDSLTGFQTAHLSIANVLTQTFSVVDSCDREDMTAYFASDLTQVSLWKAVDTATGDLETPTAVAVVGGSVKLTLPAGTYKVSFSDPSTRADYMKGWVSDEVMVTSPGS